jgi:hypothetical protein
MRPPVLSAQRPQPQLSHSHVLVLVLVHTALSCPHGRPPWQDHLGWARGHTGPIGKRRVSGGASNGRRGLLQHRQPESPPLRRRSELDPVGRELHRSKIANARTSQQKSTRCGVA